MNRIQLLSHNKKSIIKINLANCLPEETLDILPQAKKVISAQSRSSALVLVDVSNAKYNPAVSEAIKEFVRSNQPYIKASAVVGADGVRMVLLTTVSLITHRDIRSFAQENQALDWLAGH